MPRRPRQPPNPASAGGFQTGAATYWGPPAMSQQQITAATDVISLPLYTCKTVYNTSGLTIQLTSTPAIARGWQSGHMIRLLPKLPIDVITNDITVALDANGNGSKIANAAGATTVVSIVRLALVYDQNLFASGNWGWIIAEAP